MPLPKEDQSWTGSPPNRRRWRKGLSELTWNPPGCSAAEPPSFMWPWHPGTGTLILRRTFPSPLSAFHVPVDAQRPESQALELLRRRLSTLPGGLHEDAQRAIGSGRGSRRYRILIQRKISAARINCHGDYRLGQLLYTGKDFFIIDFEGEPARPIGERRLKRTPLRDVAGLLRSFDYAAHAASFELQARGMGHANTAAIESWARYWYGWVSTAFLKEYLPIAEGRGLLPQPREDLRALLEALLLDRAFYEVGRELDTRLDWLAIPLRAIAALAGESSA